MDDDKKESQLRMSESNIMDDVKGRTSLNSDPPAPEEKDDSVPVMPIKCRVTYKNKERVMKISEKYSKKELDYDVKIGSSNENESKDGSIEDTPRRKSKSKTISLKDMSSSPTNLRRESSGMSVNPLPPPDSAVWGKIKTEHQELKVRFEGVEGNKMKKIEGWYLLEPVVDPEKEGDEFGIDFSEHEYLMRLRPVIGESDNLEMIITRKVLPPSIDLPQSGVVHITYPFTGNTSDDPGLHEVRRKILSVNKILGTKKGVRRSKGRYPQDEAGSSARRSIEPDLERKSLLEQIPSKEIEERENRPYLKDIGVIGLNSRATVLRKTISKFSVIQHKLFDSVIHQNKKEICILNKNETNSPDIMKYKPLSKEIIARNVAQPGSGDNYCSSVLSTFYKTNDCHLEIFIKFNPSDLCFYNGSLATKPVGISFSTLHSYTVKKNKFTYSLPVNNLGYDCSKSELHLVKQNLESDLLPGCEHQFLKNNCLNLINEDNRKNISGMRVSNIVYLTDIRHYINPYTKSSKPAPGKKFQYISSNSNKVLFCEKLFIHFLFQINIDSLTSFVSNFEGNEIEGVYLAKNICKINKLQNSYDSLVKYWAHHENLKLKFDNSCKKKQYMIKKGKKYNISKLRCTVNQIKYLELKNIMNFRLLIGNTLEVIRVLDYKTNFYRRCNGKKFISRKRNSKNISESFVPGDISFKNNKMLFKEKKNSYSRMNYSKSETNYGPEYKSKTTLKKNALKIVYKEQSSVVRAIFSNSTLKAKSTSLSSNSNKKQSSVKKYENSSDRADNDSGKSNKSEKSKQQKHPDGKEVQQQSDITDCCSVPSESSKTASLNSSKRSSARCSNRNASRISLTPSTMSGFNTTPTPSEKVELEGGYIDYWKNYPDKSKINFDLYQRRTCPGVNSKSKINDINRSANSLRGGDDTSSSVSSAAPDSSTEPDSSAALKCPPCPSPEPSRSFRSKNLWNKCPCRGCIDMRKRYTCQGFKSPLKNSSFLKCKCRGRIKENVLECTKKCCRGQNNFFLKKCFNVSLFKQSHDPCDNKVCGKFCVRADIDKGLLNVDVDPVSRKKILIMLNRFPFLKEQLKKFTI